MRRASALCCHSLTAASRVYVRCAAIPVVCPDNACQNGGTCVVRPYNPTFGYYQSVDNINVVAPPYMCQCALGWYGVFCEIPFGRCTAGYCLNGGVCRTGTTTALCNCPCGYAGPRCEYQATNVDPASVAVFAADGRGGVGYRLEFCSLGMCQNGANCVHSTDGQDFRCQCRSGWSGLLCTTRVRSAASTAAPSLTALVALLVALSGLCALF